MSTMMAPSLSQRGDRPSFSQKVDRLSALPDDALVRVLSHLVSDEAARTSALSRRWRAVHEAVPVINLVDTKTDYQNCNLDELKVCFDLQVTSAILCKGMTTPIRTFCLSIYEPPYKLLDQWIATAVNSGVEYLDIKLRYRDMSRSLCPFDMSHGASADFDQWDRNRYTKTDRRIFHCPTLRRLRLKNWTLDLPGDVAVESLETLCLVRIMDPNGMLQKLISSCPRLANLTLQECPSIKEITVPSPRLQSFAMICCHNASSVELHSTCVQSLHYKGGLPPRNSPLFRVANYQGIKAMTIDICENLCTKGSGEVAPITKLVRRCTKLMYLHLSLHPSMAYYNSLFTSVLRGLRSLTHLSLQGCLPTDHAIRSVTAFLLNTTNLKVLSLSPLGPEPSKEMSSHFSDAESDINPYSESDSGSDTEPYGESDADPDAGSYTDTDGHSDADTDGQSDADLDGEPDTKPKDGAIDNRVEYSIRIPESLWRTHVRCLDRSVRRISIGNYKGRPLEKMLARFLLSRSAALDEFSVTLAAGLYAQKDEIAKELASWRWNRCTRVTCKLQRKSC
ncbi:unnamed protein product [Alopecurus aequalis]